MVKKETNSNKEKNDLVNSILNHEGNFRIYFNPQRNDVLVPDNLRDRVKLALEFGYDLAVPIDDFTINKEGIGGILSFNRTPFYCWVPWDSIFCITVSGTNLGKYWEDDVPTNDDILKYAISKSKSNSKPNRLKSIDGGKKDSNNKESEKKEKDYSHLRVIK